MPEPTAADYGWIRHSSPLFAYAMELGYSLTLVRGLTPAELVERIAAEPLGTCHGSAELVEKSSEFMDDCGYMPESSLVGVCAVRDENGQPWSLALNFSGDLGVRPRLMEPLSTGTRAVTHSSNGGKPMDFFHWHENGELRITFEHAARREGSTPDALNIVLTDLGLDPYGDGDPNVDRKAAVLALTERLTRVRVTEALLQEAEFELAELPEEPPEEWHGITIDLRPH
ncbi:DUF6461 domain-containing protein [Streptomyces sp. NPDC047072]|uniref:DUF6461 domain-containing protein n=1 Tax=Streptomyces sp. NPDC047072 TaxID=3154809 RepID=UPI0033E0CBEA